MQIESLSLKIILYFREVEEDTAGEKLIFSSSGDLCQVYNSSVGEKVGQVGVNCKDLDAVMAEVVKHLGKD